MEVKNIPSYRRLGYSLDDGIGYRATIGLIALATEHTLEHEWRNILERDGVTFHTSRVANSVDISPESLAAIARGITDSASLLLPGGEVDVIAFGCTSASVFIGEENVFELIRRAHPSAACTTPITAARMALEALNAKKIAVITPYVPSVNAAISAYLAEHEFKTLAMGSFENGDDNQVPRISGPSLETAVLEFGGVSDVEAVFVSCTNIRLCALIPTLEARLRKPVISSNYAMAWHALRLAGVTDIDPEVGALFTV